MSFKKTLRGIEATSRRWDREEKRRQRELEKQQIQLEKMQELERAEYEVEVYENNLDVLMSIHKDCGDILDWETIKSSEPPGKPEVAHEHEEVAQANLKDYKPSISDKLLNRVDSRREELVNAVRDARQRDKELYKLDIEEYKRICLENQTKRELAKRINIGDESGYIDAIKFFDPFSEIEEIGSDMHCQICKNKLLEIFLKVNSYEVIPREIKTVLKSGKLSVMDMPKTRFYALYQDYVCGCVLRIGRETFALLPVDMFLVNAIGELLNSKTGLMEYNPILSVAISRRNLNRLNFEKLDPSDAMDNFVHNMKFMKTKGFQAVEKLNPSDIEPIDFYL